MSKKIETYALHAPINGELSTLAIRSTRHITFLQALTGRELPSALVRRCPSHSRPKRYVSVADAGDLAADALRDFNACTVAAGIDKFLIALGEIERMPRERLQWAIALPPLSDDVEKWLANARYAGWGNRYFRHSEPPGVNSGDWQRLLMSQGRFWRNSFGLTPVQQ
jgi:hypothetical protein